MHKSTKVGLKLHAHARTSARWRTSTELHIFKKGCGRSWVRAKIDQLCRKTRTRPNWAFKIKLPERLPGTASPEPLQLRFAPPIFDTPLHSNFWILSGSAFKIFQKGALSPCSSVRIYISDHALSRFRARVSNWKQSSKKRWFENEIL